MRLSATTLQVYTRKLQENNNNITARNKKNRHRGGLFYLPTPLHIAGLLIFAPEDIFLKAFTGPRVPTALLGFSPESPV